MSEFPENIFVGRDDDICVLEIEQDVDFIEVYDSYQQYIRADLVTKWQPIETLTSGERVIVLFDNDHIDSGWLDNIDERRFFRTGHGKLPLTRLTHWMPIPKVPR